MKKPVKQLGFTLIEIFIALAIGVALFAGVLSVFVGMQTTTSQTTSYGELQENGRFAISLLTNDLQRQDFWGAYGGAIDLNALQEVPLQANVAGDCIGDGVNNASFPSAVGHFRTLWGKTTAATPATYLSCITNAKPLSDIVQIKRAVATAVLPADVNNNRYYIISNANSAAIFAGAGAANIPDVNNGTIWEYQHHIYYVREDSQGSNKVPVLVQGRLQNAATEMTFDMMVEGIEKLHLMYGVDTDDDGVVNVFLSADNMTDEYWDHDNDTNILAVRIYLLVRDILPDVKYTNDNIYQLGDSSFNANGDNYRRLLFTSTVTLYNARTDIW